MLAQLPTSRSPQQAHGLPVSPSIVPSAKVSWPQRPDPTVLSKSIPLFFISPDDDGFWIACEADFRVGGIFLFQHSALRFAERWSAPTRCATMVLEDPHRLTIENKGNRFLDWLRPLMRRVRRAASERRPAVARWSFSYIEDRMLRVALAVDSCRARARHSNKNDDDLPLTTELPRIAATADNRLRAASLRNALRFAGVVLTFALILAAIIAVRVAIWLPRLH